MINAGAIVISSLLKKGMVIADRFDYVSVSNLICSHILIVYHTLPNTRK